MSEDTTLNQLTLLPEDFLASLTVLPGSEEAQKMTATSGQSLAELLEKCDRDTSLPRTFLESSPPISTRCYLTWNVRATPARRLIFQLVPSMPRTDESGYSLLPTASAWDGKRGPAREYDPKSPSQKDRNLNTFARVFPRTGMWPTPQAMDVLPPRDNKKLRIWNNKRDGRKNRKVLSNLREAVHDPYYKRMWPTPQAGANNLAAHNAMSGDFKKRFCERAGIPMTGQLNSEFVEWLMGFPKGWTDLEK